MYIYKQRKTRKRDDTGVVSQEMMDEWMKKADVCLMGGGRDESPHCYKRLEEVLEFHGDTVEIEEVLTPLIVCMAGDEVRDPFKD